MIKCFLSGYLVGLTIGFLMIGLILGFLPLEPIEQESRGFLVFNISKIPNDAIVDGNKLEIVRQLKKEVEGK